MVFHDGEHIDYPTLLDPRPTMYDCEQNIPGWRTPRDHQEVSRRLLALNSQYERHGPPKINFFLPNRLGLRPRLNSFLLPTPRSN